MKKKFYPYGHEKASKDREKSSDTHYVIAMGVIGRESPFDIAEQLDRTEKNILNICKAGRQSILYCMKLINSKSRDCDNEQQFNQFMSRRPKEKKEHEMPYYGD